MCLEINTFVVYFSLISRGQEKWVGKSLFISSLLRWPNKQRIWGYYFVLFLFLALFEYVVAVHKGEHSPALLRGGS